MTSTYSIGDKAWIYLGNHRGQKTESTVVHMFNLDYGNGHTSQTYYVCEVKTAIDPLLEVREAFSMARSADVGTVLEEAVKRVRNRGNE